MVITQTAREGILEYCVLNSEDTLGGTSSFPDDIATNTQYALNNQVDNIPAHSLQHGRKRRYSSNPNWMFYVIFATGILMLVVTEMFLRLDYSKLVPQTGPRSDYFISNRRGSNIKRTEREKVQDVRYAAANTDVLPMYSEATTMPKRFTPTMHRKNSWLQDPLVYQVEENIIQKRNQPRVFYIDPRIKDSDIPRRPLYVPDSTQLYQSEAIDSIDISLHDNAEECFPMNDWQSAYYPTCNEIHQMDVIQENMQLFGINGYWRYAFRIDYSCPEEKNSSDIAGGCKESVIFKTLKFEHNFEANNYEHDRIDALAMEHLTSSKHVINIFSHCGNSVVTEYADGDRVGTLADTKKKEPLARLKIARDIASGLADVHEANLVHFDVNLANIVSIGGTLKLNDFNIGVMQKRNVTSGKTCDFPSQFSNPQWRSPEEANGSKHLTEKVDVFSLGNIFFRLICLHEPWHRLEPDYKKGEEINKAFVNEQVKKGVLPAIPNEIMRTSDAEVRIIREAMLACYSFDPEKRPSARSIASFLSKGIEELASFERRPGKNHWGSFRLGKKKG